MIAVTGASGYIGGRVARLLSERGVAVRGVVRDASRASAGLDVGVASGYGAGSEMRAALEGASALFLVPAEESLDRVEQHKAAVDAALAAGVSRIVYLSFMWWPLCSRAMGTTARRTTSRAGGAQHGRGCFAAVGEVRRRDARGGPGEPRFVWRADWQVEAWISTYTAIASGVLEPVTDVVERLAGHPPMSLADYVRARSD